ncbi:MAG: hypothetical protein JSW28_06230 [Thermoplasmata archaeon]|nr:MAG: hypothetical protein JSW28_06230 [Thermoplasmata archaeon]
MKWEGILFMEVYEDSRLSTANEAPRSSNEKTMGAEIIDPKWATSAYTLGGALLVLAGVLNMMARIDIVINFIVSFLLVAAGYGLLGKKDWGPGMGIVSTVIAVPFTLFELALFYFVFPVYMENLSGLELVTLASLFIIPMDIMCIISFYISHKLRFRLRLSPEKQQMLRERCGTANEQCLGNCPICGYDELEYVDGVEFRCAKCGFIY